MYLLFHVMFFRARLFAVMRGSPTLFSDWPGTLPRSGNRASCSVGDAALLSMTVGLIFCSQLATFLIDVDSRRPPVSSNSFDHFLIGYVGDPRRSQMASSLVDRLICVSHTSNFSNEAAWIDGPTGGTTVGRRCSSRDSFGRSTRFVSRPNVHLTVDLYETGSTAAAC
jgi:hypothetical protein